MPSGYQAEYYANNRIGTMAGRRRPRSRGNGSPARALLFLLAAMGLLQTKAMKNPCHPASHKVTPAYGCTKIVIPKGMCSACSVANITSRGHYEDCTSTTRTENPLCLAKFEEYLLKNPCDTPRKKAYELYLNGTATNNEGYREEGRSKIDYFLYSVCEQSCDCIPLQSSSIHREVEIRRGNCQAHTRYDICKVLPNIRLIRGEGTPDDDVTNAPRACEGIASWWNSPDRDNWQNRQDHEVSPAVAYFLHRAIEASEMVTDDSFWNACFNLETSQDRISDNNDGWQVAQTDGLPAARNQGCFIWHGGKAYLIGGENSPTVSVYDPRIKKWSNHSTNVNINVHHSQCVSMNNRIWFPNAWTGAPGTSTSYFATYNPVTQKWDKQTHPALPVQRRRGAGASVAYKGKIYTSHGITGSAPNAATLGLLDVYDPKTKTWTALSDGAFPRYNTGGGVVRDPDGHDLFCVAGGVEGSQGINVLPTECYNFQSGTWETRSSILTPRGSASFGTTCDRKLMVAGGQGGSGEALTAVEVFDGQTWNKEPSLNVARYGTGIAFDCSPCGEAHITSGSPTSGGSLSSTETFFREGISCSRPLESAPTASPRPPTFVSPPTPAPTPEPQRQVPSFALYINSGYTKRKTVLDGIGRSWVPDRFFIGGRTAGRKTLESIDNTEATDMIDVFRRSRFSETNFTYEFTDLQPGNYKVSLHFAETFPGKRQAVNKRKFNVELQGSRVLTEFDVFKAAGGGYRAIVEEFIVVVRENGTVKIDFLKGTKSNPMVNAIAIEALFEVKQSTEAYKKNLNCGSLTTLTDGLGRQWVSDKDYFQKGGVSNPGLPASVVGTETTGMQQVYKIQRTQKLALRYRFGNIPNAYYKVTLHFMEQLKAFSAVGRRQFHIDIQGKREVTNYDIFRSARGRHRAVREILYPLVTGRELNLNFLKGAVGVPIVAGIQIEQMPSDFSPPQPSPQPQPNLFSVRISLGSSTSFIVDGVRWIADSRFVSTNTQGSRSSSAREIESLPDLANKEVMRTARSGSTNWSVILPRLPQGPIKLRLYWAELDPDHFAVGSRVFHVNVQGKRVSSDVDIVKLAGAPFRTVFQEYSVTIGPEGVVRVDMIKGPHGDPILHAIEMFSDTGRRLLRSNETDTVEDLSALTMVDLGESLLSSQVATSI